MKYFFGVDGGGTKTQCYIGDESGKVFGEGFGGRANYQTCGIEMAKESIETSLNNALRAANIKLEQLTFGVLGLSGADEACDYVALNQICDEIFGNIPYEVVNDTWIGLRTGASFGVVSICGTGAAHAGLSPQREHKILRNIDFETGNRGGGSEIVSKALHYAFRSEEGTYKKTLLEEEILNICHLENMDQLCEIVRTENMTDEMLYQIPIKTFELATLNDEVATEIIREMGYEEGLYASALIKKLGMEKLEVPLVLIGGLFKTNHPVLIGAYMEAVHQVAPLAYYVIPKKPPVLGALKLALEGNELYERV